MITEEEIREQDEVILAIKEARRRETEEVEITAEDPKREETPDPEQDLTEQDLTGTDHDPKREETPDLDQDSTEADPDPNTEGEIMEQGVMKTEVDPDLDPSIVTKTEEETSPAKENLLKSLTKELQYTP